MGHPGIQLLAARIKGYKSFVPGEEASVDKSGHGTHIAGIVLDLTRNVELYIAKIFSRRVLDQQETVDIRERMVRVCFMKYFTFYLSSHHGGSCVPGGMSLHRMLSL